jgi:hypothetical protein
MLLLGDFWACQGQFFGYFSRSPLNPSPPTLGGPHPKEVARARDGLRSGRGPYSIHGSYEIRTMESIFRVYYVARLQRAISAGRSTQRGLPWAGYVSRFQR